MHLKLTKNRIGLVLGPLSFLLMIMFFKPDDLSSAAIYTLATTVWMAIWWMSEAVPIPVTALLPVILFPLSGALSLSETTACYGDKFVFLFLGGFALAIAIEKWNLHKRMALNIIHFLGSKPNNIILGFMLATAFLSMWISNTATAVMILPVGLAIIHQFQNENKANLEVSKKFGKAILLSIAYSASIGGMATLIGTPPNLVFAGVIEKNFNTEISFFDWFKIGFPLSIILLFICWMYITRVAYKLKNENLKSGANDINRQLSELGSLSKEEKSVLLVFVLTAIAWITKSFVLIKIFPFIDDTIIAIICLIFLFVIPSSNHDKRILDWRDTDRLPWGILILFGGGMALAQAFESSELAVWLGQQFHTLQGVSIFLLIIITVAAINFLTEITSNLATTAMILPVLIPFAISVDVHPYYFLIGATLAASCAFMLPAATPPNAVVFASGHLKINDMVKKGFWMNIISIIIISLFVYYLLPFFWDFK
ncbi:MAG: SLC13 family permease [Flavobacterium sp.]